MDNQLMVRRGNVSLLPCAYLFDFILFLFFVYYLFGAVFFKFYLFSNGNIDYKHPNAFRITRSITSLYKYLFTQCFSIENIFYAYLVY
jgi:hypothetical protein